MYIVLLGVNFKLDVSVSVTLSFPPHQNSFSPPRIAMKVIKHALAVVTKPAWLPKLRFLSRQSIGTWIPYSRIRFSILFKKLSWFPVSTIYFLVQLMINTVEVM